MYQGELQTESDRAAVENGCYYDAAKASKAIKWITSNLGVTFYLWQEDVLRRYFGWRKADGSYRYQQISTWVPKKNGKSWLISALLGYKLFELRDVNLYSCAYNSKQASIVLDGLIRLIKRSPTLGPLVAAKQIRCFSSPYRREIINDVTGVKYLALADNENANDGLIGQVLVVDELHRMKNSLYDVTKGCTKNITGSLEVIISTAGTGDKTHRSWEKYSYAKAVAAGEVVDISVLPIIYECLDELRTADEIYSLDALVKCNPILQEDAAKRAEAERGLQEAKRQRNDNWWRRFSLNQWVSSDGEALIAKDVYRAAEVAAIEIEQGLPCYVGVDKSAGQWDFTAVCLLWDLGDGRIFERHYAFAVTDRLEAMQERDDTQYGGYVEAGELTLIPAAAVADEWLTNWLRETLASLSVQKVALDPYAASYIAETLASEGYEIVHIQQSNNRLLTPVIEDYAERVRQGRLIHLSNSLYDWQLSNANRIVTAKDLVKVVKKGSNRMGRGGSGHIDSIDAAINAMAILRADAISGISEGSGGVMVM